MYTLGYNSFWSFGSAAVQELLTKSNLTLDELLDEDGLILEVKNHNQNLYDFILKEDNFKELISCAISIPDVEQHQHNQKKCYKYPFTSADILSSDSQPILSEFFKTNQEIQENARKTEMINDDGDEVNVEGDSLEKDKASGENQNNEDDKEPGSEVKEFPFLDHLFNFLNAETLNLTSAGYFAKIVNNLLNKGSVNLISYIYERKPELLQKMIQHIYSKSIAEFLAKVLTFEKSLLANPNNEVYNERRSEVLKEIVKKLKPESDIEEINNTAYLICEVFGKYNSMHCSHEILQNLLDKQIIDYFFDILKSGKSTSSCAVALILGNIFAYYILVNTPKNHDPSMDDQGDNSNHYQQQIFELSEDIPLLAAFIENLDQIIKFIGNSDGDGIPSQYGSSAAPFGSARLKVLELIIIAMKANNKKIYTKLVESNFLETLLSIFVKHEWNNMLHNQVEKIISHIIEGNSDELKTALFEKANILAFIAKTMNESDFTLSGKHARKVRKGYLGHLIRLSNKIIESKDTEIQNYIEASEEWKEYVAHVLIEANRRDKTNFGGRDPRAPNNEPDVHLELPSFMQKFSKFLNIGGRGNEDKPDNAEEDKAEEEDEDIEENNENDDMEEEARDQDHQEQQEHHEAQEHHGHQEHQEHHGHHLTVTTSDEFITETDKHVISAASPKAEEEERIKQATVPVRGRHSFDPASRFIPDHDERIKEENENIWVLKSEDLKTIEETTDPKFYSNAYFTRGELFDPEDILKECEGL